MDVSPAVLAKAQKMAASLGFGSVGALASEVLSSFVRNKSASNRSGRIPRDLIESKGPPDPRGETMRALRKDREEGW